MLKELQAELLRLESDGRLLKSAPARRMGRALVDLRGSELIDFTNWDFLGIGKSRSCCRAVQREIEQSGIASGSPRLLSGSTPSHLLAERRLAEFLGRQSTLMFSSRNQAVLTLISTLVQEGDLILAAEEIQTPVGDAAYLVNADFVQFNPNDPDGLKIELEASQGRRRVVVFLETVRAATGAVIDFSALLQIMGRFPVELILDETFALGALGLRGAGSADFYPFERAPLAQIGDLAAGLGAYGAFIAGDRILSDFLLNHSRTFRAEAAAPALLLEGLLAAIDLVEVQHGARERLAQLKGRLLEALGECGFDVVADKNSPLCCIGLPSMRIGREYQRALFERGCLVEVAPRLRVFSSEAILRIIVSAEHSVEQIESLAEALSAVKTRIN